MSDYLAPALGIGLPFIGGAAGSIITKKNVKTWYRTLKKPSWNPPDKAFGIAWSALYGCMGFSSYLVWRDGGGFDGDAAMSLAWYTAQLALNWAWTPIFFHFHSPKWAFAELLLLWGGIAGTIYNFSGINTTATYLMLPYLGWVSFAGALNFRIWRDNGDAATITDVTEDKGEKKE